MLPRVPIVDSGAIVAPDIYASDRSVFVGGFFYIFVRWNRVTSLIWEELGDLFESDDGSLGEIRVDYLDSGATARGYALLQRRAADFVPGWSNIDAGLGALDAVPRASALSVGVELDAFHVRFSGLQSRGTSLPVLGVFVFPHQLAIDYQMGPHWGERELSALFELLRDLTSLDPKASLSLEEGVVPDVAARFQNAWRSWSVNDST